MAISILEAQKRKVEEEDTYLHCPICNEKLKHIWSYRMVMDGNSCYQCSGEEEHKFWIHPFNFRTIHYNKTVSETDWDWERCWRMEGDTGKFPGFKSCYIEITEEQKERERDEKKKYQSKISSSNKISIPLCNTESIVPQPLSEPSSSIFFLETVYTKTK